MEKKSNGRKQDDNQLSRPPWRAVGVVISASRDWPGGQESGRMSTKDEIFNDGDGQRIATKAETVRRLSIA